MRERDRMIYDLARLGLKPHEVDTVVRSLPAIQRAHEADCSIPEGEWRDRFLKAGDRAWNRVLTAMAGVLVGGRPVRVLRQPDPRGCTVAVYAPTVNPMTAEPMLRLSGAGFTADQLDRVCMAAGG